MFNDFFKHFSFWKKEFILMAEKPKNLPTVEQQVEAARIRNEL
jgi:hypothetical protein